jgi:hypothetical protein
LRAWGGPAGPAGLRCFSCLVPCNGGHGRVGGSVTLRGLSLAPDVGGEVCPRTLHIVAGAPGKSCGDGSPEARPLTPTTDWITLPSGSRGLFTAVISTSAGGSFRFTVRPPSNISSTAALQTLSIAEGATEQYLYTSTGTNAITLELEEYDGSTRPDQADVTVMLFTHDGTSTTLRSTLTTTGTSAGYTPASGETLFVQVVDQTAVFDPTVTKPYRLRLTR